MSGRIGALAAAAVTAVVVNFFGVVFFFRPIAEADAVAGPPVPQAVGFLVYVLLSVVVLDWASRQVGHAIKAGLIIAAAQVILVLDLVARGERGVATGAAGSVLILLTWVAMGAVYGRLIRGAGAGLTAERAGPGS